MITLELTEQQADLLKDLLEYHTRENATTKTDQQICMEIIRKLNEL